MHFTGVFKSAELESEVHSLRNLIGHHEVNGISIFSIYKEGCLSVCLFPVHSAIAKASATKLSTQPPWVPGKVDMEFKPPTRVGEGDLGGISPRSLDISCHTNS